MKITFVAGLIMDNKDRGKTCSLAARHQDDLLMLSLLEPEKMPWHVTAIQSYWPLMTLTKPFSACLCTSLSLASKTA